MGSLGNKIVIAKTSGESPLYDGRSEDGNFPTITSVSGEFGGEMTLNGFFSAKNSSQTFFYKGDPENVGVAPFGNAYKSSLADSYSGNGACLSAPKNAGQTGIGDLVSGNDRNIPVPATDEFFFTGMMKIITTNYGGGDAQIKIFRMLNDVHYALMYATPQWDGFGTEGHAPVQDFVWSIACDDKACYGPAESGNAVISGDWIRYMMYYKASPEANVDDGCQLMARKNPATGKLYFQFWLSDATTTKTHRALNDWRKKGNVTVPSIFKPAGNVVNMYERSASVPRNNIAVGIEMPYYARGEQIFECRLDCLYGNDSMESVVFANNSNIDVAFDAGKFEFAPHVSRTTESIVVDSSVVASHFAEDEDVYVFVVNSNRQPSDAKLVRAAV